MSARSQLSILSLDKISVKKIRPSTAISNKFVLSKMTRSDSQASSEGQLFEDLPPSYSSTLEQDVDETSTKESAIEEKIVTSQPRANSNESLELSTRSSLQSTKLSMDLQLANSPVKRPVNNAWNERVVIQNIHKRDQIRLLCFCATALGGIAALAFYCTQ